MGSLYAVFLNLGMWQSMAYCTGLENRRLRKRSVSSNLTVPAKFMVPESVSMGGGLQNRISRGSTDRDFH